MNKQSKLLCAAVFLSALWAPFTLAQELEEIVVTAQKRSQSVNDVAIAINAFGAQEIKDLGYVDITQIAHQTPNLNIKYTWGNSMPVYTIRGVGMNSFQASDTSSVGLYVDDVFQTSVATMGAFLFDIERVEVLKGPQGTLFGRNTNGGAVNYLTRAPSLEESSGHVRADFAQFDRVELEAAFGGPINDNWAARGSITTMQQGDGPVFDRTSGKNIGEVDIWALRGQLLYQPSDDFSARLIVFASQDKSQPVYFQHFGTLASRGVPCDAYRAGRLDPNTCFDWLGYSDTDGDPYAGDYTDRFDTEVNSEARLDNSNVGGTLIIDKALANMDLRSVTSFQTYDRFQPKESDGTAALFVDFLFASQISAWSQEFRLSSNNDSKMSWIVGAQVSGDTVEETPDRIGYLDDVFGGFRYGLEYEQERFNAAIYGQVVWQLNDEWRLELGGRALYDDVDFFSKVYQDCNFTNAIYCGPDGYIKGMYDATQPNIWIISGCPDPLQVVELACQTDDTGVAGKIGLDWSPNDDILVYGSVSTGYKPGGYNGGLVTNSAVYLPFEEEEVLALELGLKATVLDGRGQFNAAIFNYDYKGLQASTARETATSVLTFLTNLDSADISGAEAEFRFMVTENLEINLGASVLDTKNNDPGANFNGPYDFNDSPRKLANAPENSFNIALGWDIPLSNGSRVRLFTDYNYEGNHFNQIVNSRALETTNSLWNARVTWYSADENLSLALYGKNLADDLYRVSDLGAGGGLGWGVLVNGMPRVIGASVNYNF